MTTFWPGPDPGSGQNMAFCLVSYRTAAHHGLGRVAERRSLDLLYAENVFLAACLVLACFRVLLTLTFVTMHIVLL